MSHEVRASRNLPLRCEKSRLIGSGYRKDTTVLLYGYYSTMRCEIIGQWGSDHKERFLWIGPGRNAGLVCATLISEHYLRPTPAIGSSLARSWRRHKKTILSIICRHSLRGHATQVLPPEARCLSLCLSSPHHSCGARTASAARIKKVGRARILYIRDNIHNVHPDRRQ